MGSKLKRIDNVPLFDTNRPITDPRIVGTTTNIPKTPQTPQTPQTPIIPPVTPPPVAPPAPLETAPKVYKNEQGRPSGIEINGKTYLGLSPKDVDLLAQNDANKNKYNPDYQPAVEQGYASQQMRAQQQVQAQQ
jgi:hypothetical protein